MGEAVGEAVAVGDAVTVGVAVGLGVGVALSTGPTGTDDVPPHAESETDATSKDTKPMNRMFMAACFLRGC